MMSYVRPLLLEPRLDLGPRLRLELAAAPPDEVGTTMPDVFGELFRAYRSEGPPACLVLSAGPGDAGEIEDAVRELAPWLPDLALLMHPEEPSRSTLTSDRVSEVRVRAGRAEVRRLPLPEAAPSARYVDRRGGGQTFKTESELLLAWAERHGARPDLGEHLATEVADRLALSGPSASRGARVVAWDAPVAARWVSALERLGLASADLVAGRERLLGAVADAMVPLYALARPGRDGARAALDPALRAAADELGAPSWGRFLAALGPGPLPGGGELFEATDAVRATQTARAAPSWPRELVVVGRAPATVDHEAGALCLDTRCDPAPVVIAEGWFVEGRAPSPHAPGGFLEIAPSLDARLALRRQRRRRARSGKASSRARSTNTRAGAYSNRSRASGASASGPLPGSRGEQAHVASRPPPAARRR